MHTKDRGVKFDEEKPESRLKILRLTNLNGQTALGVDYARLELCGKQIGSDYIQARRILWSGCWNSRNTAGTPGTPPWQSGAGKKNYAKTLTLLYVLLDMNSLARMTPTYCPMQ